MLKCCNVLLAIHPSNEFHFYPSDYSSTVPQCEQHMVKVTEQNLSVPHTLLGQKLLTKKCQRIIVYTRQFKYIPLAHTSTAALPILSSFVCACQLWSSFLRGPIQSPAAGCNTAPGKLCWAGVDLQPVKSMKNSCGFAGNPLIAAIKRVPFPIRMND